MFSRGCVAAAVVCAVVVVGCSDDPQVARPRATSGPTASEGSPPPGEERSVTGARVLLPPAPAGGFGRPVTVLVEGAPPLRAEVASRPDQRARGLMQRATLPEGAGMVFLFPRRSTGGFYMLGTLIPLSIAYVDGDRVVSTAEMEPCPGQECRTYPPAGPYTMAVEAAAGFFREHGITAGARVRIEGETDPPS